MAPSGRLVGQQPFVSCPGNLLCGQVVFADGASVSGPGVTEASVGAETRDRLDRDGYAPLPAVLSGEQVTTMRVLLDELVAAEGDRAGIEVHQEAGTDRLADLINKGKVFEVCFTHPRVLACIYRETARPAKHAQFPPLADEIRTGYRLISIAITAEFRYPVL
jgi:hypothetical protein